jgi:hypothetical protein
VLVLVFGQVAVVGVETRLRREVVRIAEAAVGADHDLIAIQERGIRKARKSLGIEEALGGGSANGTSSGNRREGIHGPILS